MDRINYFFSSMKNIALAILLWGIIGFGILELGGCVYVNFIQKDPGAPVEAPSVEKAQYQAYVRANHQYYYSDNAKKDGGVIILKGFYSMADGKYRYNRSQLVLDEEYFGPIEFKRRQ